MPLSHTKMWEVYTQVMDGGQPPASEAPDVAAFRRQLTAEVSAAAAQGQHVDFPNEWDGDLPEAYATPEAGEAAKKKYAQWDEGTHPRGQPENKGEFRSKDEAAGGVAVAEPEDDEAMEGESPAHQQSMWPGYRNDRDGIISKILSGRADPRDAHALNAVMARMSPEMVKQVNHSLNSITFYDKQDDLLRAIGLEPEKLPPGSFVGGAYNYVTKRVTLLRSHGKDTPSGMRGTIAHEFGHVLDRGPNYKVMDDAFEERKQRRSWQADWLAASEEEILQQHLLTAYAETMPEEAWAEYSRLVITNRGLAQSRLPKCWAIWRKYGLVT